MFLNDQHGRVWNGFKRPEKQAMYEAALSGQPGLDAANTQNLPAQTLAN